ncbi:MAG: VOC family protein [Chloroherpetonaceae bacterium]|nr:VOC family protein [Chloroherpetonaceae bacterium]
MKLHHLGFVVANIEEYERKMVYESKIKEVIDDVQQAKLSLYANFGSSFIELIEPLSKASFTYNALQKFGNHFHHLCYAVGSAEEMNAVAKQNKLILFRGPLEAKLFDLKPVFFFFSPNKTIVEFLLDEDF